MRYPSELLNNESFFAIHTVRAKLLLSFSSFLLLTCMMILTVFWFDLKEERVERLFTILNQLNLKVKEISKMEKDFFSYESINPSFYQTKESRFLSQRATMIRDVDDLLNELKHTEELTPIDIDHKIELISQETHTFERHFDTLVHLIHQRGFQEFGLEGRMRQHIHFIENETKNNPQLFNKLLMIRRYEKNFMLTKQMKYMHFVAKEVKEFVQIMQKTQSTNRQAILLPKIEAYEAEFRELVLIEEFIGFHNHSGLKSELIILTDDIERLIKELNVRVFTRLEELSVQIKIMLIFVMILGISLNIILGYVVTQRLGRPIIQLSASIRELIQSDFAPDRKIAHIKTKDEIGGLSQDLRKMMDKIEENTDKIREQNVVISKAYKNVKLLSEIGQKITSYLDAKMIILNVYDNLNNLMSAEAFGVGIYKSGIETIDFEVFMQNGKQMAGVEMSLEEENRLAVWCLKNEKEVLINNFEEEYSNYIKEDIGTLHGGVKTQSMIYLPLISKNRTIGVLTIQSFQKNAYSEYHLSILQNLATYIATALENAHVYYHIENQNHIIAQKNKDITDSINYAYRIQQVVLPPLHRIHNYLPELFVFYKPRDIVSGDFYWFYRCASKSLENVKEKYILAAADCTGHGVPGAFMSVIGNNLLENIVQIQEVTSPELILTNLHKAVLRTLRQDETGVWDGMDIAICTINKQGRTLEYAGARNPLVYVQLEANEPKTTIIKPDRKSIGGRYTSKTSTFTKHTIQLKVDENPTFYIYSDGYQDQFGGWLYKKFMNKRLYALFEDIHDEPINKQENMVKKTLQNWVETESPYRPKDEKNEQIDDILIIGFRLV